jgi:NADH dehydrogenase FAD-containing subunit
VYVGIADPRYPFMFNATNTAAITRIPAYDYIVVGGGATGCPLAATLSQNFTVLLLERGGEEIPLLNVLGPMLSL